MFGVYRTVLALFVVLQHLGGIPVIGQYAVQGFFVLSGYLMTYVMHNSYGYTGSGRIAFATNRFLRLFPSYWAALVLSVIVITVIGAASAAQFHPSMRIPDKPQGWLSNLTMIYPSVHPNTVSPRLSPATWALTIELVFYAAICLGASSNRRLTIAWVGVGVAYHVVINTMGFGNGARYFAIPGGSLPFALGALLYFFKDRLSLFSPAAKIDGNLAGALICIVPVILAIAAIGAEGAGNERIATLCYYLNMAAAMASVAILQGLSGSKQVDRVIGDLSYHLYILHWIVGMVVFVAILGVPSSDTYAGPVFPPLLLTIGLCIAISLALTRFIDRPIEQLRKRVKSRSPERPIHAGIG